MTIGTVAANEKDLFRIVDVVRQTVQRANGTVGLTDGDKGDVSVASSGAAWTINAGAVDAGKLATDAVTADKIADDNVTTDKIADGDVTNAKLAAMTQATVKGRASGAGTGDPSDLSASQLVAIVATADGSGSGLDADLWKGATYTVSTSTPSGGSDGDFWFEREA